MSRNRQCVLARAAIATLASTVNPDVRGEFLRNTRSVPYAWYGCHVFVGVDGQSGHYPCYDAIIVGVCWVAVSSGVIMRTQR